MASPDEDGRPSLPNPWDAILEAVKHQLPSLDSDSSASDCEDEELFIFQRNQTVLIPDLSEELADDPAGAWVTSSGSPPELAAVPVESAMEPWGEWNAWPRPQESAPLEGRAPSKSSSLLRMSAETPPRQDDDAGGTLNTSASQSPRQGPQGEATRSPQEAGLQTEPLGAASQAQEGSDAASRKALRRERRKMIEKDILHKVTWDGRNPACPDASRGKEKACDAVEVPSEGPPGCLPVLSLQELEEWDLDQVLLSLTGREEDRGDGAPGAAWWAAGRLQGQDHTEPSTQDRLMERLSLLCARQSRTAASAWRVPADTPREARPWESGSRWALLAPGPILPSGSFSQRLWCLDLKAGHLMCISLHLKNMIRCASRELGFQALAQDMQLKNPAEPPTIFTDLRPTKTSDQEPLESSSSYSSSSDSEEAEETAAQRDLQGPARLRDCTGKSRLLQQLRASREASAWPQLPAGKSPVSQKAQAPGDPAGSSPGVKQHVTLWAERGTQARPAGGRPSDSPGGLVPPWGQLQMPRV
ncbi:dynein axonemal assembly factor 8 isoform X1 [Bos taurus]|uniref:Dynein axonemal assembly factor 8 n=1 Tax=Bos taurus TaxID=9913 RepID=E1BFT7_BOVIN|nr:dynein axonemal assembly factor 8 isoform X1 [Bos taurus]XP_059737428.1 dynein axonemal assembly factor 8 isoform X1 [Bos taurus]